MSTPIFAYNAFLVDSRPKARYCALMESLSRDEINELIVREKNGGSLRSLARRWGLSAAYLSDVLLKRREVGPTILAHLGLKRTRSVTIAYASRRGERKKMKP